MNRGIAKRHTKADKKPVCKTAEPAFAPAFCGTTRLLSGIRQRTARSSPISPIQELCYRARGGCGCKRPSLLQKEAETRHS